MIKTETFFRFIGEAGIEFFTGVPDSQLSGICNYIENNCENWVMPNEGTAVAAATGYNLATGKVPCVYMQNSGIGNAVNPICSLTSPDVYAVPMLLIIGWRGEPGVHDEPQHVFQGKITPEQLELLSIPYLIADANSEEEGFFSKMKELFEHLSAGKSVAVLVKKGGFSNVRPKERTNPYTLLREDALIEILRNADDDIIVSSTGKISREIFEIREKNGQGHEKDFLTVGSMGHCSSIALAIAVKRPDRRVICIDGDGALLMHMGAMAMIGGKRPDNLIHIVMDNEAHETVGGTPTVSRGADLCGIAKNCGYSETADIDKIEQIMPLLSIGKGPKFIRIRVALGSRDDLGRPTIPPAENKKNFMKYLEG
jgi:phosphonopyruvate decarboxylase